MDCRQDGAQFDPTYRVGYQFNSTIAGIDEADAILLIGTNPRLEAPIINARIRKRALRGGVAIGLVGEPVDLTYNYEHLGNAPLALEQIARGVHGFSNILKDAKRPMLIIGTGAMQRQDGLGIQLAARQIAEAFAFIQNDWNGFNVLHTAAGRVGALALGFVPQQNGMGTLEMLHNAAHGALDVAYVLGADELDMRAFGHSTFVIYQGHHGDAGAHRADVILPGAAYTEKNATYMNTEGRVQFARQAVFPPGEAKEDWKILRALSEHMGHALPYNTLAQLRHAMAEALPAIATPENLERLPWAQFAAAGAQVPILSHGMVPPIENYYMTDVISRASVTMAKCSAQLLPQREAAE
jgi:NADH-quinone oxidoreductase subunit G